MRRTSSGVERRRDIIGKVVDDPRVRVVDVEQRGRRIPRDPTGLPGDEERRDRDDDPDREEPGDDLHERRG